MKLLITGGAGFIGSNAAEFFLQDGFDVFIYDNLSRKGGISNIDWLKRKDYKNFHFIKGDITDKKSLDSLFQDFGPFTHILHLAAQVAVTLSINDPLDDFNINALGSFYLLESIRIYNPDAAVIYASTNKVYGHLPGIKIDELEKRYQFSDFPKGISELQPLDFHSPYGCSKGTADQYFLDYSRIFGLKTVSFRQSCIYGKRQFGIEDQGWIAWFTIAANFDKKITVFGDGKQVRDVLYIDDLLKAYQQAFKNIDNTMGKAYNIGGNTYNMSLLELIEFLEEYLSKKLNLIFDDWREGDQKVFISDIKRATEDFYWKPEVDVRSGVSKLTDWVIRNTILLESVLAK